MRRLLDALLSGVVRLALIGGVLWAFWHGYGRARWPQWKVAVAAQFADSGFAKPLYTDGRTAEAVRCQRSIAVQDCPSEK